MNTQTTEFHTDTPLEMFLSTIQNSTSGGLTAQNASISLGNWYPNWGYTAWCNHPNDFEKAFKVVQKLMEKKIVKKIETIEDFVKLVNDVHAIIT